MVAGEVSGRRFAGERRMLIRSIAPALAIATFAAASLQATAYAADYPVLRGSQIEDAPLAPSMGSAPNWQGFYLGGGAGVSDTKFKPGTGLQELARYAFRNTNLGAEVDMGQFVNNLPSKA